MAQIKAVVMQELLSRLRNGADADESVEETVQGALQGTLPTATVRYIESSGEVSVDIDDGELISTLLRLAVFELETEPVEAQPTSEPA